MRRALASAAIAVLCGLSLAPAAMSAAVPRASFNDIEDEVMCVTCHVALNIAQSVQADQERTEIRRLVGLGLTKPQVLRALVGEYGDGVLADPPNKGFNIAAWLVPAAAVGGVAVLLGLFVARSHGGPAPGDGPPEPALSSADTRRLDEDLARYEV